MAKIENDRQLGITRERLKGAYRALELSGADTDHSCIESILFAIISLQEQMIEYLDCKPDRQSQVTAAAYTLANQLPKQIDQPPPMG